MARFSSNESIAGMSQTSWLRLPITSVIWRRKARSRREGTWPRTLTSPLVGYSKPESILSVVVLPAPLGPRKPTISPGATSNEMPSTAWTSRERRRTRLRSEASTPASRSWTTYVLRKSRRWITEFDAVVVTGCAYYGRRMSSFGAHLGDFSLRGVGHIEWDNGRL